MTSGSGSALMLTIGSEASVSAAFEQLLCNVYSHLEAEHLFIASLSDNHSTAHTVAYLHNGEPQPNFSYSLKNTPCETVCDGEICAVGKDVIDMYPHDALLQDMAIQGYLGAPIVNDSEPLGILVALYTKPNQKLENHMFLFQVLSDHIQELLIRLRKELDLKTQMELFDEVGDIAKAGGWSYNIKTDELYWSKEVYRIYGYPPDSRVSAEQAISHYKSDAALAIQRSFEDAVNNGNEYTLELPFVDNQGKDKWVRTSGRVLRDQETGDVKTVYGAFEDVTLEHCLLENERFMKSRYESILDSLHDAVITVDLDGDIIQSNEAATKMFGYSESEFHHMNIGKLMPEPYRSHHGAYMAHYLKTGAAKILGRGRQLTACRKNGDVFQMELFLTEEKGQEQHLFIGVIRDISERIRSKDKIFRLAFTDEVTELPNLNLFEKELEDLIERSRSNHRLIYCALVDIDDMSLLNLKYGKDIANEIIKKFSQELGGCFRYGGKVYKKDVNSFYVLASIELSKSEGPEVDFLNLHKHLKATSFIHYCNEEIQELVTSSFGSTTVNAKGYSVEALVNELEFARVNAKENKPKGVYHLTRERIVGYERKIKLLSSLKDALLNNEFYLEYQPQFDAQRRCIGAEALMRWTSAEFGKVSPEEFIPLAEESGFILNLGEWLVESVCRFISTLSEQDITTQISVNISGKQFVTHKFETHLFKTMEKWDVPAKSLMLELTETSLVKEILYVKKLMTKLKESGFRFSIDDFGTGYSSLAYLKSLPISELKIDKCFVDEIKTEDDAERAPIVDMVIDMARALKVVTVAEGVENKTQFEYLRKRGCTLFQGYHLSKPISESDFIALVKKR